MKKNSSLRDQTLYKKVLRSNLKSKETPKVETICYFVLYLRHFLLAYLQRTETLPEEDHPYRNELQTLMANLEAIPLPIESTILPQYHNISLAADIEFLICQIHIHLKFAKRCCRQFLKSSLGADEQQLRIVNAIKRAVDHISHQFIAQYAPTPDSNTPSSGPSSSGIQS